MGVRWLVALIMALSSTEIKGYEARLNYADKSSFQTLIWEEHLEVSSNISNYHDILRSKSNFCLIGNYQFNSCKFSILRDSSSVLYDVLRDTVQVTINNCSDKYGVRIAEFKVVDLGFDDLPTSVRAVDFGILPANQAVLKSLRGVYAIINGVYVLGRFSQISSEGFKVELMDTSFTIPNGKVSKITFFLYFDPASITDNERRTIHILNVETNSTGSAIQDFPPIRSNTLNFSIVADTLNFSKFQSSIRPRQVASIDVKALDRFGNTDYDFPYPCNLTFTGPEKMFYSQHFTRGVAKFTGITLEKSGLYKVTATSGNDSTTKQMLVSDDDSFLKSSLLPILIPQQTAINKPFDCLKFMVIDNGTSDTLSTCIRELSFQSVDTLGNNLQYRTIDSVWISVNSNNIGVKGISFIAGKIVLKFDDAIISTPNSRSSEILVGVKLRQANYQMPFMLILLPSEIITSDNSSIISEQLCYPIKSDTIQLKDGIGNLVRSGYITTKGRVHLELKQPISTTSTVDFLVSGYTCDSIKISRNVVDFRILGNIVDSLCVKLIIDNNASLSDSVWLKVVTGFEFGDITVSEIMSDPSPVINLPEVEYVELYNRCTSHVDLTGWKVLVNGKQWLIGKGVISPQEYVIVTSTSGASLLSEVGKCIVASYFEGLPNAGADISILNNEGSLIANSFYSDKQLVKAQVDGGRSLEKMDINSPSEGEECWGISTSALGGTPGTANSIQENILDIIAPKVVNIKVLGLNVIRLEFNEPIFITKKLSFRSDNNPEPVDADFNRANPRFLKIQMANDLKRDKLAVIEIEGITDYSGNIFSEPIPIALCTPPLRGELVINEVLFNPDGFCSDYVELLNNSIRPLDLAAVCIASRDKDGKLEDIKRVSATSRLLMPNDFAVICSSVEELSNRYIAGNSKKFIVTSSMPGYSNDMGVVVVLDTLNTIIDELAYTENMHYKMLPSFEGVSLERINPSINRWQSASKAVGYGTPGIVNSQYLNNDDKAEKVTLVSEVVSPDSDGYNDFLGVVYKLEEAGVVATVDIFTARGMLVKRICRNELLSVEGMVTWDGITDGNLRISRGIYLVVISLIYPSGKVELIRKPFSIAYR